MAIAPYNVNALTNKGVALYDLGRYQDAIVSYNKALALNPSDVDTKHNVANALTYIIGNTTPCSIAGTNVQKPPKPSRPNLGQSFFEALG